MTCGKIFQAAQKISIPPLHYMWFWEVGKHLPTPSHCHTYAKQGWNHFWDESLFCKLFDFVKCLLSLLDPFLEIHLFPKIKKEALFFSLFPTQISEFIRTLCIVAWVFTDSSDYWQISAFLVCFFLVQFQALSNISILTNVTKTDGPF